MVKWSLDFRYVALLRGINISGKNKISMSELKNVFSKNEFYDVFTYANSGNIIFSSEIVNKEILTKKINIMIKNKFDLDIGVFVIEIDNLKEILNYSPSWWGKNNAEIYDNIIFIIPPATYEEVFFEIGDANDNYEKISNYKNVVFWAFNLKNYSKTNWIKTASSKINDCVTIRTSNTIRKVLDIDNKREKK